MYDRVFEYMRYAKRAKPGLSLAGSGAAPRDLAPLVAGLELGDASRLETRLREAIAQRYGVEPKQVVLYVGASEANAAVALAHVRSGDEVVVETPAYEALPGLVAWLGARVVAVERRREREWAIDLDELEAAVGPRTRMVMLSHPHNPSGRPFSREELIRLREISVRRDVPILVDEIYRDDLPEPPPIAASLGGRLMTTSSLTKTYGLGPLRLGWAIADRETAERLEMQIDWLHNVPPLPSVAFALAAWPSLDAWRQEAAGAIAASREVFEAWRRRTGLLTGPVFAGMPFCCAELPEADDRAVCARIAEAGVQLPAGSFFGAPGTARVGFGRLEAERLREALAIVERCLNR